MGALISLAIGPVLTGTSRPKTMHLVIHRGTVNYLRLFFALLTYASVSASSKLLLLIGQNPRQDR
jgi:hypothetical protein